MEHTLDFGIKGQSFLEVGYLRLAESFLLYAKAYMLQRNTTQDAIWINKVRERGPQHLQPVM